MQVQKQDENQDHKQLTDPPQLDAQHYSAAEDEISPQDAPVKLRDAPIIVPARQDSDALDSDPVSSAPEMTTAPTTQMDKPPFVQGGENWSMERVHPESDTTEMTSLPVADATPPQETLTTETAQPDAVSQVASDKNADQSKPERHTMSATVASLSAAASRLFLSLIHI